jgi:hypothetical protein
MKARDVASEIARGLALIELAREAGKTVSAEQALTDLLARLNVGEYMGPYAIANHKAAIVERRRTKQKETTHHED